VPRSSTVAELDCPGAARSSGHETISSVNKASVLATTRPLGSATITSSDPRRGLQLRDCRGQRGAGGLDRRPAYHRIRGQVLGQRKYSATLIALELARVCST